MMMTRTRTGYYSPPSDTWHRTINSAVRAARKALRGTGQACSIARDYIDGRDSNGKPIVISEPCVASVSDPDNDDNEGRVDKIVARAKRIG